MPGGGVAAVACPQSYLGTGSQSQDRKQRVKVKGTCWKETLNLQLGQSQRF